MRFLDIFLATLARCAPERLVRPHIRPDMPRDVVAIGKCVGALLDGVAAVHDVRDAFVAAPEGYPLPCTPAETHTGGHPHMTPASFAAGRALLRFVEEHEDLLFLVSGGGSACVEVPLVGFTDEEVASANAKLVDSGLPIARINAERRKLSAIKGGKLRDRVRGRLVTLVYSDVAQGALADVASGPTITSADEAILIADNLTLVHTAAAIIGPHAVTIDTQLEGSVEETAAFLAEKSEGLTPGQILVAGGEPTVRIKGPGKGGRCSELAVHFARQSGAEALFAGSDGVDGNSGAAGIYLPRRDTPGLPPGWEGELAVSNAFRIAAQVGEPIMITPTGNNLRDLFLVVRA
jgi:glycerate 2-kinase